MQTIINLLFLWGVKKMKIDLKRLKLHPQESAEFHFEEAGRDEFLADMGGRFLCPIKVELRVDNTGRILAGHGKIHTVLELPCSRCLEKISFPLDVDLFLNMIESCYKNDYDPDEDFIFFEEDEVDIWPYVEATIFVNIPMIPLCKPDCRGLCPLCGINRNNGECHCEQEEIDPRWEKLKKLKG